jgi:hypothetical protein
MLARFVQVSPEELAERLDDRSSVVDLVDATGDLAFASVGLTGEARERFEREAPRLLEQTLAGFDPATREAIEQRLEELAGGSDESVLLALMAQRGYLGTDGEDPAGKTRTDDRKTLSLEKAWHGVHYLLCGRVGSEPGPPGQVVLGGTEIGEDEFGYGPARYFHRDEVAEIAAELGRDGLEDELDDRFDPVRMTALAVYPGRWQDEDRKWLFDGFRELRGFFVDAAGRGAVVVTCLV